MFGIWEKLHSKRGWGKYPPEHIIRFIETNFGSMNRDKIHILDVGAGQGNITWYLHQEGFNVAAIDCEPAINQLRKRIEKGGSAPDIKIGSATELPWPDDYFDACIDNFCLCSIESPHVEIALKEIHRVLKPRGCFFSATFTDRCDKLDGIGYVKYRGKTEAKSFFESGHFCLLETDRLLWTKGDGTKTIEYWMMSGKKV